MSRLTVTITEGRNFLVMKLTGVVDMVESTHLENQLKICVAKAQNSVYLDMSELDFISSMGLSSLIKMHQECIAQQKKLVFVNLQHAIADVFATTQLDQLFSIQSHFDHNAQNQSEGESGV